MQFVRTNELSSEQRRILFEWSPDPFQTAPWGLTWRPKDHHILVYEDNQLVSHVGLVRASLTAANKLLDVGGLGGVITVPAARGRGLAQRGLAEAIRVIAHEWRLNYGALFCYPQLKTFYEGLGWTARKEPVHASQPQGTIALPVCSMVQAWNGCEWPAGEIDIEGFPW